MTEFHPQGQTVPISTPEIPANHVEHLQHAAAAAQFAHHHHALGGVRPSLPGMPVMPHTHHLQAFPHPGTTTAVVPPPHPLWGSGVFPTPAAANAAAAAVTAAAAANAATSSIGIPTVPPSVVSPIVPPVIPPVVPPIVPVHPGGAAAAAAAAAAFAASSGFPSATASPALVPDANKVAAHMAAVMQYQAACAHYEKVKTSKIFPHIMNNVETQLVGLSLY